VERRSATRPRDSVTTMVAPGRLEALVYSEPNTAIRGDAIAAVAWTIAPADLRGSQHVAYMVPSPCGVTLYRDVLCDMLSDALWEPPC